MKAKELIESLKELDPEAEVYIQQPSHDYWRTQLAAKVLDVSQCMLEFSEYHQQMRILPDDLDDIIEERPTARMEAVIRCR